MTVNIRHQHDGGFDVAVVGGVDTPTAVAHLCHSLADGYAFADQAVVIDLTSAPDVLAESALPLGEATQALERSHRWLGVVDPDPGAAGSAVRAHVYATTRDAVSAARRYFRWVSGTRSWHPSPSAFGGVVASFVSVAPRMALEGMRWAARTTGVIRSLAPATLAPRPSPLRRPKLK